MCLEYDKKRRKTDLRFLVLNRITIPDSFIVQLSAKISMYLFLPLKIITTALLCWNKNLVHITFEGFE